MLTKEELEKFMSKFPPLPEPEWVERDERLFEPSNEDITIAGYSDLFTVRQMRTYAKACVDVLLQPAKGFIVVPIEPTQEMVDAVDEEVGSHCYSCTKSQASDDDCRRIYAAMILAATPVISADSIQPQTKQEPIVLTAAQSISRIALLIGEMDANDEENSSMQEELNTLYASASNKVG